MSVWDTVSNQGKRMAASGAPADHWSRSSKFARWFTVGSAKADYFAGGRMTNGVYSYDPRANYREIFKNHRLAKFFGGLMEKFRPLHEKGAGSFLRSLPGFKQLGNLKIGGKLLGDRLAGFGGGVFNKLPMKGPLMFAFLADGVLSIGKAFKKGVEVGREKGFFAGLWAGVKSLGQGVAGILGGTLAATGVVALTGLGAMNPMAWLIGAGAYIAGSVLTKNLLGKIFPGMDSAHEHADTERRKMWQQIALERAKTGNITYADPNDMKAWSDAQIDNYIGSHFSRVVGNLDFEPMFDRYGDRQVAFKGNESTENDSTHH